MTCAQLGDMRWGLTGAAHRSCCLCWAEEAGQTGTAELRFSGDREGVENARRLGANLYSDGHGRQHWLQASVHGTRATGDRGVYGWVLQEGDEVAQILAPPRPRSGQDALQGHFGRWRVGTRQVQDQGRELMEAKHQVWALAPTLWPPTVRLSR